MSFTDSFKYNLEMNNILIDHFYEYSDQHPKRSLLLFSHILNAHKIWNNRILEKIEPKAWEMHNLDTLKELNLENFRSSAFIIEMYDENDTVEYKNSLANRYSNTIHDILFHIINHSSYHRGQIAMLSRESELIPVVTDYIFYKRENKFTS